MNRPPVPLVRELAVFSPGCCCSAGAVEPVVHAQSTPSAPPRSPPPFLAPPPLTSTHAGSAAAHRAPHARRHGSCGGLATARSPPTPRRPTAPAPHRRRARSTSRSRARSASSIRRAIRTISPITCSSFTTRPTPTASSLAQYYAQRRHIPAERVLALTCPTHEEITREEFDGPSASRSWTTCCSTTGWNARSRNRAAAATARCRSSPPRATTSGRSCSCAACRLKIADAPSTQPGMESEPDLKTNAAAVDSELALLPV